MKILIAESSGFSDSAMKCLREHATVEAEELDREALLRVVGDVDVLWVRLRHLIDREVFAAAPHLKIIVSPTTGLDHIDMAEASRRAVSVLSLRGESEVLRDVRATAEHTIGLILSLLRHIPAAYAHVQAGKWDRERFKGRELYGKVAGIVGYGRLGKLVGQYLAAFDMQVLATDPAAEPVDAHVSLVGLPELLCEADVVTLHVELSEQTHGLFGLEEFQAMKPGAIFINTARGELVHEPSLLEALRSGQLAGAALDVISNEQRDGARESRLVAWARRHDRLLITPHVGGCTQESMEKTEVYLCERLISHLVAAC